MLPRHPRQTLLELHHQRLTDRVDGLHDDRELAVSACLQPDPVINAVRELDLLVRRVVHERADDLLRTQCCPRLAGDAVFAVPGVVFPPGVALHIDRPRDSSLSALLVEEAVEVRADL